MSILCAFPYCTASSISSLAMEKGKKKMQPLDRLQPSRTHKLGAHALLLFTDTQQQEVTVVVSGASPASASCKYREKKQ